MQIMKPGLCSPCGLGPREGPGSDTHGSGCEEEERVQMGLSEEILVLSFHMGRTWSYNKQSPKSSRSGKNEDSG